MTTQINNYLNTLNSVYSRGTISLLKDIYRVLKPEGVFSFQMGYGKSVNGVDYYAEVVASSSNGDCDVRVDNEHQIHSDLTSLGYKNIRSVIRDSWSDSNNKQWIYTVCQK